MALGNLPVPGRPTICMVVGQGPTALAVGAGGGCLDIFTLNYPFSPLSPSLWETARYRLLSQRAVKPKTTNQPTNQPTNRIILCCLFSHEMSLVISRIELSQFQRIFLLTFPSFLAHRRSTGELRRICSFLCFCYF